MDNQLLRSSVSRLLVLNTWPGRRSTPAKGYQLDDLIALWSELYSASNLYQNWGHTLIVEEIIAYCGQYANFSLRVVATHCHDMDNRKNYKNKLCCRDGEEKNGESG